MTATDQQQQQHVQQHERWQQHYQGEEIPSKDPSDFHLEDPIVSDEFLPRIHECEIRTSVDPKWSKSSTTTTTTTTTTTNDRNHPAVGPTDAVRGGIEILKIFENLKSK